MRALILAFLPACLLVTLLVGSPANCAEGYSSRLKNRISWNRFPIKIFFVRDSNYDRRRQDTALDGFDRWGEVTDGYAKFRVVDSSDSADVVVRFDPRTNDGRTTMRYRGDRLYRADMMIGVERDADIDIESTAAHEFGHALGINGHSDSRRDLMYPAHFEGTRCRITERDLDTLISIYPAIGDWLDGKR